MAKVMGINHVCFVVRDYKAALRSTEEILGGELIMTLESMEQKYMGVCVQLGESIISLLQPTDESSFMAKFIEEKGGGVQHVGLEVDNLEEFVQELESKGVRVDKEHMKDENYQEALVGPRIGNGVVLQLSQWKGGPMDVTPEGKERLEQKYREVPGLRLIE
ncbi:VOC family protein [Chloroflexota bacterium]